jgi:pimeloyl-ACP methyl ester carboxylesterase
MKSRSWVNRVTAVALVATAGWLTAEASPAAAVDRVASFKSNGPGPEQFDRVYAHQIGPKRAERVLVLMPGTLGGAGDFVLLARDLVERVDDLQVWAIDRRSRPLEDTAMFEQTLAGERSLTEMFDYYLGWLAGANPPDHVDFLDPAGVPFARRWGMEVALDDARKVVRSAGRKGREVVLGGHSLGASLTAAYAAWDFRGKPGFKDVEGLVLIDGGLLGSFDAFDLAKAQQQVAELESSSPFLDLLGLGIPEIAGIFAEVEGVLARRDPSGPSMFEQFPLLPDQFRPPVPATNAAGLGYAFDRDTSPPSLGLLHVNAGGLAAAGDPRPWEDGGVTPIARLAENFGQEPSNGVEWFFPRRLTIDTNGADRMKQNDVADFLGLRLKHTKRIDVPIYAFQTDLTDGGVLSGARALVKRAKTARRDSMLVDGAPRQSHLDPLTAAPKRNEFLKKLVVFLDGVVG